FCQFLSCNFLNNTSCDTNVILTCAKKPTDLFQLNLGMFSTYVFNIQMNCQVENLSASTAQKSIKENIHFCFQNDLKELKENEEIIVLKESFATIVMIN
ncbi:hypothetical protein BpHYR1_002932, partial [Brachionus plicatilis]